MTIIDEHAIKAREHKTRPDFLQQAYVFYDECDLSDATYFEIRPVSDRNYTYSTYLYGHDTNEIQVRMGRAGRPCELIAKYRFNDARAACREFFELSRLGVDLWYNGNDVLARVTNRLDLVTQIAVERFFTSDPEFAELLENTALNDAEQAIVRAKMVE